MARRMTLAGGSALALAVMISALAAATATASHSWGGYHWAQASSPSPSVTVPLGDSLTTTSATTWPVLFKGTSGASLGDPGSVVNDWSNLHLMPIGAGNAFPDILNSPWRTGRNRTNQKRCRAYAGTVEVCNSRYGFNGWLGLAQVWTSGGHIVQAVAKMNDSYLDGSRYNNAAKQHVLCQEVGHAFGLDHQDESGADLNTCMDYASGLDNPHPNAHDNEQINAIYRSHTDSSSAASSSSKASFGAGGGEARRLRRDLYLESLGNGVKLFTFVTWAGPRAAAAASDHRAPG